MQDVNIPFVQSIQFIIVLYNCRISDSLSFNSILNAKSLYFKDDSLDISIYDNSSLKQDVPSCLPGVHIEYYHDQLNSGVSKAYNYFASIATLNHKNWLFLLDQDSSFSPDFILKYRSATELSPHSKLFAPIIFGHDKKLISPSLFFFNRGFRPFSLKPGIAHLTQLSPINSGMMIKTELFNQSGGFDENVPLDYSDFAFLKRVKHHINQFFIVDTSVIHSLSVLTTRNIETAKIRFKYLTKAIIHVNGKSFITFLILFVSSIRLSLKYKNPNFIFYLKDEFIASSRNSAK